MIRGARLALAPLTALLPALLLGQSSVTAGGVAGTVALPTGNSQSDLNGILKASPSPWLAFTATITMLHVTTPDGTPKGTSDGLGDLPLSAAVAHALPLRWSPELGAALDLTLPTGDASRGLGSGTTTLGADLGIGLTLHSGTALYLGASRELRGSGGTSAFNSSRTTSLGIEGERTLAAGWRGSVALEGEVGTPDSGVSLHRTLGVGVLHTIREGRALTVDASHGIAAGSPGWALAIGVGGVFGGNNPVSGILSSRRLAKAISSAVGRGNGRGHIGHP